MTVPQAVEALAERSAAPDAALAVLRRLAEERAGVVEDMASPAGPTARAVALVRVVGASNSLGRLCVADPDALDVLDALDRPGPVDASSPEALARSKRLELLRIAARDLLGMDSLDAVGTALADLAQDVLQAAVTLALDEPAADGTTLALIGMGKLGGRELNYASDVDVLFVTRRGPDEDVARRVLRIARLSFRVDADLRPEGRAGPLTRSLDGYRSYWDRWAATWEFQALLKARAVAGDAGLGGEFERAAHEQVWGRNYSADEIAAVRSMKARAEGLVAGRGLTGREIKRGPGGIRDIEFAVQLLQLVHGRNDPGIRDRSTLGALDDLADAGYVARGDATVLARAYRFLRTVEHRLQLVEEEQTHSVPADPVARRRLALVMGFEDDPSAPAVARFDDELRRCQRDVRAIHERLFFRPLLEAFATVETTGEDGGVGTVMSADAVARRLDAFGFADVARTRAAVEELAGGLTRSSRLMAQLLPLLLDWLSLAPDPDLGLLGLRNLTLGAHQRSLVVSTFRESSEAARRLCLLLGSSLILAEAIERNPELIATIGDDEALAPTPRPVLVAEAGERLRRDDDETWRRAQLVRIRQDQHVRIAARDLLDVADIVATGQALAELGEALLEVALEVVQPDMPFSIVGMGRLGGGEMAYASDLDVLLVYDGAGDAAGETVAEALLRFMHGPSPAQRVAAVDLGLRPEGGQGRLARDLDGYAAYFERWAQTWERQAMLRARVVAGDRELGARFMALARDFVWDPPLTDADVAAIRRMKARMERERIPARDDPQFHLKLGRGSLSDVEWTVQLLQLRHGLAETSTMTALEALAADGALAPADVDALRDAYRFCERTRNRWHLVGALPGGTSPGDALPTQAHQLSRLARSLGTTPAHLRDDYRRVTRRARRVVERAFYGIEDA
ncbi:MAG TPA: bifunctional [glutamine synthetase] adenylyltransferase/[glutamine synthetase]-adenylyl-L-tyrosine phosphorylase [Acidimicrobiales bacterium]|nr:bifunctional [glutamine synthetase] adenylyltransferase/[glutamine synthetase]-adenylyl-L-tyrosine phosphorylase [Acidimicrobiales bacterium]